MTHHTSFAHCLLESAAMLGVLALVCVVIWAVTKLADWLKERIPRRVIVPLQVISFIGFLWLVFAAFCYMEAVPK